MLRDTLAALSAESASASAKTAASLGLNSSDQLPSSLSSGRRGEPAIVRKAAACIDEELHACALHGLVCSILALAFTLDHEYCAKYVYITWISSGNVSFHLEQGLIDESFVSDCFSSGIFQDCVRCYFV